MLIYLYLVLIKKKKKQPFPQHLGGKLLFKHQDAFKACHGPANKTHGTFPHSQVSSSHYIQLLKNQKPWFTSFVGVLMFKISLSIVASFKLPGTGKPGFKHQPNHAKQTLKMGPIKYTILN